jgi:tetratricopeptide (TPR) repeat protein
MGQVFYWEKRLSNDMSKMCQAKTGVTLIVFLVFFLLFNICSADEISSLMARGGNAFKAKNYDVAISLFSKAIQLDTNYPNAYFARGWAYEMDNQSKKALADMDQVLRLTSSSYAYMLKGRIFSEEKMVDEAIDSYSQAIRLDPLYSESYADRGQAYVVANNYNKAVADYNRALRIKTNSASIYNLRAYAYAEMGRTNDAIADFNKSIALEPNDASVFAGVGLLYAQTGNYKVGIANCEKAINIDTNYSIGYNNLAWLLSVVPDASLRNGRLAVEYAQKAGELDRWNQPYLFGTLAAAYAEVGDFDKAVKLETKSIQSRLSDADMVLAVKQLNLYKQKKPYYLPVLNN